MGWRDDHEPLIYEFYHIHMEEDETLPHMLSHGAISYSEVQLPVFAPGETEIKAVIINTLGARAEVNFTVKVSFSSSFLLPLSLSGSLTKKV